MGYLALRGSVPPVTKAVLSFWFRVPQETMDAASAAGSPGDSPQDSNLYETIPLLTFGDMSLKTKLVEPVWKQVAKGVDIPQELLDNIRFNMQVVDYTEVGEEPTDPCFVGLKAVAKQDNPEATVWVLLFVIQTATRANVSGQILFIPQTFEYSSAHPGPHPFPQVLGSGWENTAPNSSASHAPGPLGDNSTKYMNRRAEFFRVQTTKEITPNHWHHLLLSFDISAGCKTHGPAQPGDGSRATFDTISEGVDIACHFWYAIDDVNYDGAENLGPYFVEGGNDKNAILTRNAYDVADTGTGMRHNLFEPPSECFLESSPVNVTALGFGIPATAQHVSLVRRVEMAELQFFTGVTLDPVVVQNRRAFVDGDGVPVPPVPGIDGDGNLIPMPSQKLLGKKPEILLHGSANWSSGYNTGTLGLTVDVEGNPLVIPGGQFAPNGQILSWKPDPTLRGPQVPPPPSPAVRLTRKPVTAE